ncbi:MAG: hypothetical protein AAGE52_33900 [Myxococcota bacterium]
MSDPQRLAELEDELAEMLQEARAVRPSDAEVALVAQGLPPGGPGGGPGFAMGGAGKWAAAAVALLGVGIAAWLVTRGGEPFEAQKASPSPAGEEFAEVVIETPSTPDETIAQLATVETPAEERPAARVPRRRRTPVARRDDRNEEPAMEESTAMEEPTAVEGSTAMEDPTAMDPTETENASDPQGPTELALLDRARALLRRSPGDALQLANAHQASFPRGSFAEERELIAVEALVRLGRRPDAEARSQRFRRRWPSSVHASRISAILAQ